MKSITKSKILILMTLTILFTFMPIMTANFGFITVNTNKTSEYKDDSNLEKERLKFSAVSGPIHIIGNSGWVDFRNDGNCTGSGTYSDPYVIEDLVIDGGGSRSCIWIENSDVYFKIENCTVYNSVYYPNAGIRFSSVNSSQLIINNCSSNRNGIGLENCYNNTISGNTANNNNYNGVDLRHSDNNTVSGNIANNNSNGIHLWYSDNNDISGNIANNNYIGVDLIYSDNNTISGNTVNYNDIGISLSDSNNHTLSGNIMNECGLRIYGNFEIFASHIIDSTNLVNGKPLYYYTNEVNLQSDDFTNAGQVIMVNCNDSLISNLNTSYCYTGIYLYYCNNNYISGNTVNNNSGDGIYLRDSDNNTVSGNTLNSNSGNGLYLRDSDNNTVSGNTANYNSDDGIYLSYSNNNIVINNDNLRISLGHSHNNYILGNTANYGIYLDRSDYNTISGNIMNEGGLVLSGNLEMLASHDIDTTNLVNGKPLYYYTNEVNLRPDDFTNAGQVILVNCNDSLISSLNISYCSRGISLHYCNNNTISGNTANYNTYGIRLSFCNNNSISGNTANNNDATGIYLSGDYNTISGNTANNNFWNGIYLDYDCVDNTILQNTVNYNRYGIELHNEGDNNIISGNTVNNNIEFGISLTACDYITVSGNIVNNNSRGISLSHCDYNTVSGNTANNNYGMWPVRGYGIFIWHSDNNDISGNTANYNDEAGIYLYWCISNTISGNTANYNTYGIEMHYSNNTIITGNILLGNDECIIEENCSGNIFQNNDCGEGIPLELIIIISSISGGAVIGVATFLLIRRKRKKIT